MTHPLRLLATAAASLAAASAFAQDDADPILFSVDDTPVYVSEFDYIYAKTNGDSADYSRESLSEYLDLYRRFKLKVARARAMGLDTVEALNNELAGYRKQLADSYLVDDAVTEPLARELAARKQEDVDVLHLSVDVDPADTAAAYAEIAAARERLAGGADWAEVARGVSSDPSAKANGGAVGFVTAPLPEGLYALENAVYKTPLGELSPIVRSERGYHLVKPVARRPARGEVEAAHIFLRKPDSGDDAAVRARIDSIYQLLEGGADFEQLARELSEDTRSAPRGGYIGYFGINRYERSLEEAAFGLETDGAYSEPVETRVGWHVVRRLGRREPASYEESRQALLARVKRLRRFDAARRELAADLRARYGFRQNDALLDTFFASLTDTFLDYQWAPQIADEDEEIFALGDGGDASLGAFVSYLQRAAGDRVRARGQATPERVARTLYERFLTEHTISYAEERLDEDNLDFANLMREYREGILLFEATKQNVWDAAGLDTAGLEAFFAEHREDYRWAERAVIDEYVVAASAGPEVAGALAKEARKKAPAELLARYNAEDSAAVAHAERRIERGRDEALDAAKWKPGTVIGPLADERSGGQRVLVVREVLAPTPKKLDEARGYVIADYQDELERRWVAELAEEYEVEMNDEAFEALVREP